MADRSQRAQRYRAALGVAFAALFSAQSGIAFAENVDAPELAPATPAVAKPKPTAARALRPKAREVAPLAQPAAQPDPGREQPEAVADRAEPEPAPTAPAYAPAAVVPHAPAAAVPSANPEEPRSWLMPPREQAPLAPASSTGTSVLLIVLLAAAGGAAYWFKKKRGSDAKDKHLGLAQVHVLASSRIGPKANAVAIEFADQVLLLGVTETTVSVLQSLDKNAVSVAALSGPTNDGSKPAAGNAAFKSYLDGQLERDREPSAAERLAELTSDRANVRSRAARELVDVEGQAAGLAARLQKRTWEG